MIKVVINDDAGSAAPSDFTMNVSANNPSVASFFGSDGAGTTVTLEPGPYTVSESGPGGYGPSFSAQCFGTIALGEAKTCTVTNDDIAPDDATLTVIKQVSNNNGGTELPEGFIMTVSLPGGGAVSFPGSSGTTIALAPGDYRVTEVEHTGYVASYSADCSGSIESGQDKTCIIINDDIGSSLTLVKDVINDNGGAATADSWTLTASGPTSFSGTGPSVSSGLDFAAGSYDLGESGPDGYSTTGYSCVGGSQIGQSITLALGESAICTITNDDVAPSLTLVKEVTNDNGGTESAGSWTLTATGPTGISGAGPSVSSGPSFDAGSYVLGEIGPDGYSTPGYSCVGGNQVGQSINLALGESATCTITNDDIAPSLTLVKQVVNDDGGSQSAVSWTLTATGPTGFSGAGPSVSSGPSFDAGSYALSEGGPAGYSTTGYRCVGGTQLGQSINLALGETATCTIINDDIAPTLTVIKHVVNDNEGTAAAGAFNMFVSANNPSKGSFAGAEAPGTSITLDAGPYSVGETGPSGYAATFSADCSGFITLGEAKTCTITNFDIAPNDATLTVFKQVVNDNGGTAVSGDFIMTINLPGGDTASFPGTEEGTVLFLLPGEYSLLESGPSGYYGDLSAGCSGIVSPGENANCIISNDDIAPSLTLVKQVVNDDGGTESERSWTLTASGPISLSGSGPSVSSDPSFLAGTYVLSENGPEGYSSTGYSCDGGTQVRQTIQLAVGERVTCTITNDDIAPTLTVTKVVVPSDASGTFNLYVESSETVTVAAVEKIASLENVANGGTTGALVLPAGNYTVGETAYVGTDMVDYTSSIDCGNGPVPGPAAEITLEPGDVVVCTITNTLVTPQNPDHGFMTGGGNVKEGKGKNARSYSWGFMIRCGTDSLGYYRARFQFKDHYTKNRFHLEEVSSVECSYDESIDQGNPNASFNTVILVGTGRWNGQSTDEVVTIIVTDDGEPVRNSDTIQLLGADLISMFSIEGSTEAPSGISLTGGNHQAHGDPPSTH